MEEEYYDEKDFSLLPEGYISEMISKTSIKDACRSSAVSRVFKSASEVDSIWEQFLPCDYQEIISKSDTPLNFSTKKELFFLLCDSPLLINDGTLDLSFRLCKTSGKKCFMIPARNIEIEWSGNPRYWLWKQFPESRFSEAIELLAVCWIHIHVRMQTKFLSPKTTYAVYFVYKLDDNSYGLETPSSSCVKFIRDETIHGGFERLYLMTPPIGQELGNARFGQNRSDGWMEIYLGEFYNDVGEGGEIELKLFEIDTLNWKKGLIFEGMEVRPNED